MSDVAVPSRDAEAVPTGNTFDKYGSRNPVVRSIMRGFDRGLEELLALAGPVRSVLDVGCGEGHVTARLARVFPDARVLGTDFSRAIVDVARRTHPGIAFEPVSIYDAAATGTWDMVVACEVFEHLDDDALRAAGRHGHRNLAVMRLRDFDDGMNRFDLRHQRQIRLLLLVRRNPGRPLPVTLAPWLRWAAGSRPRLPRPEQGARRHGSVRVPA